MCRSVQLRRGRRSPDMMYFGRKERGGQMLIQNRRVHSKLPLLLLIMLALSKFGHGEYAPTESLAAAADSTVATADGVGVGVGVRGGDSTVGAGTDATEAFVGQALRGGGRGGAGAAGVEGTGGKVRREARGRSLARLSVGTMGENYDVENNRQTPFAGNDNNAQGLTDDTFATPPAFDSTLCMTHWGVPELQHELDPNGYVIYVLGREQLGGNKFLVSDGLFMAKALGRTLVEYPVKDSMVVHYEETSIGLGAYWDLTELCMYHRILDLRSFGKLVADGTIPSEGFTTLSSGPDEVYLRHAREEADVVDLFAEYKESKVIVMEYTWKSSIVHEPLTFLRPNPFYVGFVRMLLKEQKDWGNGEFLAVQWRTELATGDLNECYEEVKAIVEGQRAALGYGNHQVLFNIDFFGKTSVTYKESAQAAGAAVIEKIQQDYPQGLKNRLHEFLAKIEDSGIRAFLAGLVVAESKVMIGSSLNDPETKTVDEARRCQKPHSGYITLITEWREELLRKPKDSVVRLFPFDPPV